MGGIDIVVKYFWLSTRWGGYLKRRRKQNHQEHGNLEKNRKTPVRKSDVNQKIVILLRNFLFILNANFGSILLWK